MNVPFVSSRSAAAGVRAAAGADPGEVQRDAHEAGQPEEGRVEWPQRQARQVQQQRDSEQHGGDDGGDDGLLRTVCGTFVDPGLAGSATR